MLMIMLIYGKDDEEYVTALYWDLKDDMVYIANNILHNPEDAEDAVQIAFVNIIANLQRIQNLQNIDGKVGRNSAAYCIVIVRNVARRMYNERKAKETRPIDEIEYDLPSKEVTEDIALQNNLLASLDEIVKTLPDKLSRPFVLRYYKEMKYADIGNLLGLSANAAQKRVERAVDFILEKFGKVSLR